MISVKKSFSPKNIIDSDLCIGCGICAAYASAKGDLTYMHFDAFGQLKPKISGEWYSIPSESFSRTCPFSPSSKNEDEIAEDRFPGILKYSPGTGRFITNYIGFANEEGFRMEGSSGGMTTWVACKLMREGLIDGLAHVIPVENPQESGKFFRFSISRSEEEIRHGAKSRYYPVELSEVLKEIREIPGRYAVVAIPCMVKAVHLLRDTDPVYHERIVFTLGLFCGHMKSSRFTESIYWQMNIRLKKVRTIDFRNKLPGRPANWYNALVSTVDGRNFSKDWWQLADGDWGAGFFMNNACNYCDDVVAETADISFGDAWVEPFSSDGRGTNVVIVRSEIIEKILQSGMTSGKLKLEHVNASLVESTQAAGLRMRREGLSYRLTRNIKGLKPVKRAEADSGIIPEERKRIYRMRIIISKWSHCIFRFSRITGAHFIYLQWARTATAIYHSYAYQSGKLSEIKKRFTVMKTG